MTAPTHGAPPGYQSTDPPGPTRQHLDSGPDVSGRSLGDLMRQVTSDLSTLMRQEIELAKAEIRQEGARAGKAAGLFGGAGIGGYMVLLFLSLALWGGLSNLMDAGWAGLIVAVIWAAITAVLYTKGKAQAREVRGLRRTSDTMQRIPDALKPDREGVTREH